MLHRIVALLVAVCGAGVCAQTQQAGPIHISFLWHMHQPIYYPYESVIQTDQAGRFSFSVVDVHNQRFGPYTTWPRDAVQAGLHLPHLGAQVSFSASLIENLNTLEAGGVNGGMWNNWDGAYRQTQSWSTSLGNERLDLVAFGYHHPLMPLLDGLDIQMQLRLHEHVYGPTWQSAYSAGLFPPETAFSTRMIPALVAEGIDWTFVDNIHFDRACEGYPHTNDSGLFAPNKADQLNPDPAANGGAWVQLNNLWAPSRVSAPFGYQAHYAQHIDPETGMATRMIVVPAARYEGNEDGRGGYGAFLYDQVMDAYLQYNTDPQHPMLVALHHDGDNFGGGSESYYHHNFQNFVNWIAGDSDYDATTIADFLERFPPDAGDVIHVENGSWAGADSGDAEFKKWLGDPDGQGISPDINSWAVMVAARNRVHTAEAIAPASSMQNVFTGSGSNTEKAWHYYLCAQASDYWYWDGTEIWDSNVTRACNLAVPHADAVLGGGSDTVGPSVFVPQREPYNPGGFEWGGSPEPSDFEVWTLVYDLSGLAGVTLKWRVDNDGENPIGSVQNETFAGGSEVGAWQSAAMAGTSVPKPAGVLNATYKAMRYGATIAGQQDVLIDYYIEATDALGNVSKSDIQHVWVGVAGGGGGDAVTIDPDPAIAGEPVTITYEAASGPLAGASQVYLHYGFNDWAFVEDPDPAMTDAGDTWTISVPVQNDAWQLDMVFNDGQGVWDNNNGADWHFGVTGGEPGFEMDGVLDAGATLVASNGGSSLWAAYKEGELYVASTPPASGRDHFVFLASPPGAMIAAPWAKGGQVAAWAAYLAAEGENGFHQWFDASGSASSARGSVLEGVIDLAGEFGSVPEFVWLAMGPYETHDDGALVPGSQAPASGDGDGNLESSEHAEIELCAIEIGGSCCIADFNSDGSVNTQDVLAFLNAWSAGDRSADVNNDGEVNTQDVIVFLNLWNAGC